MVSKLGLALIVSYGSQAVRALALDGAVAAGRFGEPAAAWLQALLAEVEAASDASELFALYGASVHIEGAVLGIDIAPGLVANFAIVGDKGPFDAHDTREWSAIRRLKLVDVRSDGTGS